MRTYLKARILPAFGRIQIDKIGPEDVAVWFDEASGERPGAANRALEMLSAMTFRAVEWGCANTPAVSDSSGVCSPRSRTLRSSFGWSRKYHRGDDGLRCGLTMLSFPCDYSIRSCVAVSSIAAATLSMICSIIRMAYVIRRRKWRSTGTTTELIAKQWRALR